jgi:protoporphyrinogen oxidase
VRAVDAGRREVRLPDGSRLRYERLVSTIPLPDLVGMLADAPDEVRRAAGRLRHNRVHTIDLGFRGAELGAVTAMHWVYFPEAGTAFHRLSFPHTFAAWMAPPGCASVQAEVSESSRCPRDRTRLVADTLEGLVRVGILESGDVRPVAAGGRLLVARVVTLDPAYVIYDLEHRANTQVVRGHLERHGIETHGRFGEWEYLNMDHAILRGRDAAAACR